MDVIIETKRIILRRFVAEDYPQVLELNSNPQVQKYTGDVLIKTPEEAKETISSVWFKDYEKYGYGRFAVIYKPENKLIGFAGLKYLPSLEETDIGFRILPEYWGIGITSEIAGPIIDYGFNELGLSRIIGTVMPENVASAKVLLKTGLKLEKTAPYGDEGHIYDFYSIAKI